MLVSVGSGKVLVGEAVGGMVLVRVAVGVRVSVASNVSVAVLVSVGVLESVGVTVGVNVSWVEVGWLATTTSVWVMV